MTIQIPDDLARGLEGIATAQRKTVEQVAVESLRLRLRSAVPSRGLKNYRIPARRQSTILKPRLWPRACRSWNAVRLKSWLASDLSAGHKRHQRPHEGRTVRGSLAGRAEQSRSGGDLYGSTGEILFGIGRLPTGKRRTEMEQAGRRFLDAISCEPIPRRRLPAIMRLPRNKIAKFGINFYIAIGLRRSRKRAQNGACS
jgi:hypothetical protein